MPAERVGAPPLGAAGLARTAGDSGAISGDDDLDIGEVSRVVNLGDLAREAAQAPAPAWPMPAPADPPAFVAARAAAAARLEAMRPPGAPAPGPFAGGPFVGGPFASGPGEVALLPMPELAPSPAAVSHRRALIALIAGALVLVGVAVAVVFFVLTGEDDSGSRLGEVEEIDTTRPDEVRTSGSGSGGSGSVATAEPSPNPFVPRPPKRPGGGGTSVTPPVIPSTPSDVGKLEAREIEEMAGKNSTVTQRCYMRAQRGADGILIGDVKKIAVTLTINGDGQVTGALLSDNHAQNSLGKCLIGAIKTWKFRSSSGGTFRFVLHFG
jgi:hypothetical protein